MLKNPKRWHRTLGLYIFFVGVLLGMFFTTLLTWADFEASLFDVSTDSSALKLESLKCPILLNQDEIGTITATFANPAEWALRRTVDAHISHGFVILMREERTRFDLEPGEKHTLQWTISSEDAAWGRFILVRIHVQRSAPLPPRDGSCGVLVVNLPFGAGAQIAAGIIGASLLLMIGGAILWIRVTTQVQHKDLRTVDYVTLALGPATLLALVFNLVGFWFGSVILLIGAILAIVTIVTWMLS